jgi:hypothetical protein
MRWALCAVLALAFYFGVVEGALDAANALRVRADAKAALLAQYEQNRVTLEAADKQVAMGVMHFGAIEMPAESESRAVEFNRVIDGILSKHELQERSSTSRTVPLAGNTSLGLVIGSDYRVDRLVSDLQFVGSPEAATEIISDLERHPLVTTLSRVQLRKAEGRDTGRAVRVSLSVETWILAKKGKR